MAERQTLVLLCGIGEDEAVWAPLAAALRDVAECVPVVANGATILEMAADVLARTERPVAVAGHSLGGYVAMAMQRAEPERVTRMALLNTSAMPEDAAARAGREALLTRIWRDGFPAVVRWMAPALTAAPSVTDPVAMLLRTGEARFVSEQRAAMTRPDARPGLASVTVPVLVVGGARDTVIPAQRSVEIASAVAGAALLILPDAGHLAPIESPDAIAAAMRPWLAAPAFDQSEAPALNAGAASPR